MSENEAKELYISQAEALEAEKRYAEAEQLYMLIREPNRAIGMYRKAGLTEPMMNLVKKHHGDHVQVLLFVKKLYFYFAYL